MDDVVHQVDGKHSEHPVCRLMIRVHVQPTGREAGDADDDEAPAEDLRHALCERHLVPPARRGTVYSNPPGGTAGDLKSRCCTKPASRRAGRAEGRGWGRASMTGLPPAAPSP